jgi:hypothetical protein
MKTRSTLFVFALLVSLSVVRAQGHHEECTAQSFGQAWNPDDFYSSPQNVSLIRHVTQ